MKKKLMCKKDWSLDSVTHFKQGEFYDGKYKENLIRKGINTFVTKDKNGVDANFHSGSDYFDIPFNE